jgi:predicted GNAT family N-acyltransferase
VGIVSLYKEPRAGGPADGWRIRGTATEADARGAGYGAALVAACIEHTAAHGGGELWCNARMGAVGFYRRMGFDVVSDEFDIAGIGPHVVMVRS